MSEINDIHRPFAKWLDAQRIPYITARADRESTIAEGHPDFSLFLHGRAIFLELKTEKGRLSQAQLDRIAYLEERGNRVHVARSIGMAIEFVQQWLSTLTAAPEPVKHREMLGHYRMNGGVWREDEKGNLTRVRAITPGDHVLPERILS